MVKDNIKLENKEKKTGIVGGVSIDDILKQARGLYDKADKGLSRQLASGNSISRPSKDSDFVLWMGGEFWKQLTGLPGLPWGRIIQVSGKPNSGKSSLAAQFMAYAQKQDCFVILLDTEMKFQVKRYDEQIGGNSENLLIVDTNSIIDGTKGVAYLVKTIKDKNPDAKILIVFDSIGAAINSSENNEDNEDMSRQPGVAAKEITWSLKKFSRLMNQYQNRETGEHSIALLCINQLYSAIGFMQSGYKEKGGVGLEYMSSVIIQLSRIKDLTKTRAGKKVRYGIISRAKAKKNHMFDGSDCLAEMDIVVNATGIQLADEVKKKDTEVEGWDITSEEENA